MAVIWSTQAGFKEDLLRCYATGYHASDHCLLCIRLWWCCSSCSWIPDYCCSLNNFGTSPFMIVLVVNYLFRYLRFCFFWWEHRPSELADRFIATGIPGPQLHRLVAMSSIGLDTLPHSAGIITMLSTTKLTHRQAYINNFILSLVLPIVMACFAAVMISAGFYL